MHENQVIAIKQVAKHLQAYIVLFLLEYVT